MRSKQLINYQNAGFSTSITSVNCYLEKQMPFVSALPKPSGMAVWQNYTGNLNVVLAFLGIGSIDSLKNGDKILVEPIYDVKIEKAYHAVTETETAVYGKYLLGANSNGGVSAIADSWGFVAIYTNKHYPNELYTPDGQGLWTGVSATASQLTFFNIINQGWGVGIAYIEKKADFSPSLSVELCEAWAGSKSERGYHYGTSTGDSFANWTCGNGYPYSGGTVWFAIYFPAESENCYVKQTVTLLYGGSTNHNVYSHSGTWYDVALSPTTVPNDRSYYIVAARVDLIDGTGKVKKYGAEKRFYIPIKPTVYRYQVSAVNYTGEVQAYNGSAGLSGKVYVGQKVYAKYKYTSKNDWISYNNLFAAMHKWGTNDWVRLAPNGMDIESPLTQLSSTLSQDLTSTLGYVRVPDNSGSGSNVMRFKMTTRWACDSAHTSESTWIDLPISKPDVELYDMYLVDEAGYVADETDLEVGQKVTVYNVYKNNTDTKVFVCGYMFENEFSNKEFCDFAANNGGNFASETATKHPGKQEGYNLADDGNQIPGVFAIPAFGKITVKGNSYTVPNKRSFNIWSGVYLEGAGIGNTEWETNPNNNTKNLPCKSNHPVTIVPVVPNASYRESTDVISSFRIYNCSDYNYSASGKLKVRFKVTKANGTQIYTETKNTVIKANGENLVYFKWKVPTGLNKANVVVRAEILEDGIAYNPRVNNRATIPYTYYTTPDTHYEEKAPVGFKVPSAPVRVQDFALWSEWVYENGAFVEKKYAIGIPASSSVKLIPADGNSATKDKSSNYTMKSGYGVWLEVDDKLEKYSNYLSPSENAYTKIQYAYALFPEYDYQFGANKCKTLYLNGSVWCFNKLNSTKTNKEYHYTPLYFPDGKYIVKAVKSDMWTPSGMIESVDTTKPITISGNAYDDWYIRNN